MCNKKGALFKLTVNKEKEKSQKSKMSTPFCEAVINARAIAKLHEPSARLELQPSPYDRTDKPFLVIQHELAMRRKANILTNQTNRTAISKVDQYKRAVTGKSRLSARQLAQQTCSSEYNNPKPAGHSNVPGPTSLFLVNDPSVQLYQSQSANSGSVLAYQEQESSFAAGIQGDATFQFRSLEGVDVATSTNADWLVPSSTKTPFVRLFGLPAMQWTNLKFYIEIPISIIVRGTSNSSLLQKSITVELGPFYLTCTKGILETLGESGLATENIDTTNIYPVQLSVQGLSGTFGKVCHCGKIAVTTSNLFFAAYTIYTLYLNTSVKVQKTAGLSGVSVTVVTNPGFTFGLNTGSDGGNFTNTTIITAIPSQTSFLCNIVVGRN